MKIPKTTKKKVVDNSNEKWYNKCVRWRRGDGFNEKNRFKKKYLLVLDVETIGVDEKLVFDIGFIVADKKGNNYERRSYLV